MKQELESWPESVVDEIIDRALSEDLAGGEDVTTTALVGENQSARAVLETRQDCVVAGIGMAERVFQRLDPAMELVRLCEDGVEATAGQVLLRLRGRARALLTAERTALNLMQRLCGIATRTRAYVQAARGASVRILDTRKTTPLLRPLEKYAVRCGGGTNHRMGLYDMAMIKDNHRVFWAQRGGGGGLAGAVAAIRARHPGIPVEVEVESLAEFEDVAPSRPDWVLLDNMNCADMAACVSRRWEGCRLEASGGITLERVAQVAATGVDAISVGALTHSVPAMDLSLEFVHD